MKNAVISRIDFSLLMPIRVAESEGRLGRAFTGAVAPANVAQGVLSKRPALLARASLSADSPADAEPRLPECGSR